MNDLPHEQLREGNSSPDSINSTIPDSGTGRQVPMKLFVGSLPYDANEVDLMPIFEPFGKVVELRIQRDQTGRSRGCATLTFATTESAEQCIHALHGRYCCGNLSSPIQVKEFEYREPVPVTCFVDGMPFELCESEIWASLSMRYGQVVSVVKTGVNSAYITFYKKSSAYSMFADARRHSVFLKNMLCPSVTVTIMQYAPTGAIPIMPLPYMGFVAPPVIIPTATPMVNPLSVVTGEDVPMKLFVGCLPYSKAAPDIADLFSPFGAIKEVAILVDNVGKSRGAAFVTFVKSSDADKAMKELEGYCFPGCARAINISRAIKQTNPADYATRRIELSTNRDEVTTSH